MKLFNFFKKKSTLKKSKNDIDECISKRLILEKKLKFDSKLVRNNSILVLKDFENIDYAD
jgi:hypothetical protein